MSTPVAVMISAQAVAMCAKINDVDPQAVETMLATAEELLPHDDPLYRAITGFATQYMEVRRDPDALAMQGRILEEAAHRAAGLIHDIPERRDIDG